MATSEKLSFHDNNADADELAIYCSQVFASEERLLTIGPSTDSAKPGQFLADRYVEPWVRCVVCRLSFCIACIMAKRYVVGVDDGTVG